MPRSKFSRVQRISDAAIRAGWTPLFAGGGLRTMCSARSLTMTFNGRPRENDSRMKSRRTDNESPSRNRILDQLLQHARFDFCFEL